MHPESHHGILFLRRTERHHRTGHPCRGRRQAHHVGRAYSAGHRRWFKEAGCTRRGGEDREGRNQHRGATIKREGDGEIALTRAGKLPAASHGRLRAAPPAPTPPAPTPPAPKPTPPAPTPPARGEARNSSARAPKASANPTSRSTLRGGCRPGSPAAVAGSPVAVPD